MLKNKRKKNLFADKATYILRYMIKQPDKKWVVRDFTNKHGVSLGMAQAVLDSLEKQGYAERVRKGPGSYTILTNKDELIHNWLNEYKFDLNLVDTYYSPDANILRKIKDLLKPQQYALTLHTGANLMTSYVKTDEISAYLNVENWENEIINIRQRMDLKELVRGGNIHFIKPFYKTTAFFNAHIIKGYSVVSNLQLYLDLYNFQPRGREHAEYLKNLLEEKGEHLA